MQLRHKNLWRIKTHFLVYEFDFMPQKSSKLCLGYGIGKFDEGDDEIEDSQLLYVGDRDQYNTNPTMYALPKEKSYKWADVKQDGTRK